jgi:hypothetical protein
MFFSPTGFSAHRLARSFGWWFDRANSHLGRVFRDMPVHAASVAVLDFLDSTFDVPLIARLISHRVLLACGVVWAHIPFPTLLHSTLVL